MTDNKKAYDAKYLKENLRQVALKISRIHEQDMIDWLESKQNINKYVKALIREDMEKHQPRT